jgi:TolB protein
VLERSSPELQAPAPANFPKWSLDGGKIAFVDEDGYGAGSLYVMRADGTGVRRLTEDQVGWFQWSPDGRRVAFNTYSAGLDDTEIYVINADGTGERQMTENDDDDWAPASTVDGRIAFVSDRDNDEGEIFVMDTDGHNEQRLTPNLRSCAPVWSPDGRSIAFLGGPSDGAIYVMNADGTGARLIAQSAGASAWRPRSAGKR